MHVTNAENTINHAKGSNPISEFPNLALRYPAVKKVLLCNAICYILILTSLSLCIFIYEERLHAAVEIGRAKTPTPAIDIDSMQNVS